jgi:endonuclease YncB( thermonuclease family)
MSDKATERLCIGVVDGGMFLVEGDDTVVLARVKPPRVGIPGGAVMRMLLQRKVQDRTPSIRVVGIDRNGAQVAEVEIDGANVNDALLADMEARGYPRPAA